MNFLTLNRKNMKTNISYAILAATAILTLGSCSEGQYWTEPADKGAVVAFAKPALSMSVPAKETALTLMKSPSTDPRPMATPR